MKNKIILNLSCFLSIYLTLFIIQNFKSVFIYKWFSQSFVLFYLLMGVCLIAFLILLARSHKNMIGTLSAKFWLIFVVIYFVLSVSDRPYFYDELNFDNKFKMSYSISEKEKLSNVSYESWIKSNREDYIDIMWYKETE